MNVLDIQKMIDDIAPFETQAGFDNSGFLVGEGSSEIQAILFALDVTDHVIDEAIKLNANLIVTHHPLLFTSRKNITDVDHEGYLLLKLVKNGISLISAHTNLDQAHGGINDTLAEICGLKDTEGEGYIRVGNLKRSVSVVDYAQTLSDCLHTTVRIIGDRNRLIQRIGLCSGAGSDEWEKVVPYHADAFISGEIKHHHALSMVAAGMVAFECGHYHTEKPGLFALADALQSTLNQLELNVNVFKSELEAYF